MKASGDSDVPVQWDYGNEGAAVQAHPRQLDCLKGTGKEFTKSIFPLCLRNLRDVIEAK